MRDSSVLGEGLEPFGARLDRPLEGVVAVALLAVLFLGVAFWNGFPLMFYDTGAYLTEGLEGAFLVERSPVYSILLFLTAAPVSLWLVVILQAAMTGFFLVEVARAEAPDLSLPMLGILAVALMGLTGIGWYVGQVEPDCMTALVVLGSYLLLFCWRAMGWPRRIPVILITGLSVACHPSHLGLIGGLIIAGTLLRWLPKAWRLPKPTMRPALTALATALAMTIACNFILTRAVFISRSGPVFVFARLMQDGIVKKLLDDTCLPAESSQPQPYRLCAYRKRLSRRADEWLWGPDSAFHAQGGFKGSQPEDARIIIDSVERYPWLQVKMAARDSVEQFFTFKTGDGIESQEWILRPGFTRMLPDQLKPYLDARQQHQRFRFHPLNIIHVSVGLIAILGLLLMLSHVAQRGLWRRALLPGLVLLALMGNAIICGTFSNPHDRYQSRIVWLPVFVLMLALARDPTVLRPGGGRTKP